MTPQIRFNFYIIFCAAVNLPTRDVAGELLSVTKKLILTVVHLLIPGAQKPAWNITLTQLPCNQGCAKKAKKPKYNLGEIILNLNQLFTLKTQNAADNVLYFEVSWVVQWLIFLHDYYTPCLLITFIYLSSIKKKNKLGPWRYS